MPNEPEDRSTQTRSGQWRFAALGLEFGGGIAGCVLIGHWIDRWFGSAPWGLASGALLGCVGGMYHLVSTAWRWQKKQEQQNRTHAPHYRHDAFDDERPADD